MMKPLAPPVIRLRGVRHNNLKNFDLDLPLKRLVVITGLSGSGKSSLAFDTLFAEGQRRYIETFSPYARQFLDRMDKPQVDAVEGIPPAIAIEQRNAVRTTRSTVGTMTEICDHLRAAWPHLARLRCRRCGEWVRPEPPQLIWDEIFGSRPGPDELLVTFDLPLTEKLSLAESLALVSRQGYQRLLEGGRILRLEEAASKALTSLTVVQDRVRRGADSRARFVEACEQAYRFGRGRLAVWEIQGSAVSGPRLFSDRLHCARCDLDYPEPSPALFSFNHPVGACPKCRGFGRVISIDYNLAVPDRSRTLAQGVVKPWLTGMGLECQRDLLRMCRHFEIPTGVPFQQLARKWQDFVIEGDPDYGTDEEHQWPRVWYGVKGYFRWLESRAYKMHVRVLLSRYRAYSPCPDCQGRRFRADSLLYQAEVPLSWAGQGRNGTGASRLTLADFYQLPIGDALRLVESWRQEGPGAATDPLGLTLAEVRARLRYLVEVGLGYLTLDRPTRSLSGGETERVNLTTCLGTRLVNTLFVLDEPSIGLHARDTGRLIRILQQLRDAGNTVVVVEHDSSVMRAADQIVDLGPGQGATGGRVVFQGTYSEILRCPDSLTGLYLSGRKLVPVGVARPVAPAQTPDTSDAGCRIASGGLCLNEAGPSVAPALSTLRLEKATLHNLRDLSVEIPLNRLVCVTGVSGSGKSTLVRDILYPALAARLQGQLPPAKASDCLGGEANGYEEEFETARDSAAGCSLAGHEGLGRVVLVDQAIIGKTPRSNPGVYIGAFDDMRELFAQSDPARRRGLTASAFSFNSPQGQCERCRGAGFEKIEMQFLSDVFIRCPDCAGRRYRPHILQVKLAPPGDAGSAATTARRNPPRSGAGRETPSRSIADLLAATVDEAIAFLRAFPGSQAAARAAARLELLQEVGLGYLALGQPINTLSGGESQRLKLVRHLAEAEVSGKPAKAGGSAGGGAARAGWLPTLFLFDEPTTGLHFDDVRVLLGVFQRLVAAGHSVVIIEHNLDVIRSADWIIDLGPEAGDEGGRVVVAGPPEVAAQCQASHTGRALRGLPGRTGGFAAEATGRKRNTYVR